MKLAVIAIILCLGLSVGGASFLYSSGFNVGSAGLWIMAADGFVSDPSTILLASVSGPNQKLFLGISCVIVGVIGAMTAGIMAIGASLLKGFVHTLLARARSRRIRMNVSPTTGVLRRKARRGTGSTQTSVKASLRDRLSRWKKAAALDKGIDLESPPESAQRGMAALRRFWPHTMNASNIESAATRRIRANRSFFERGFNFVASALSELGIQIADRSDAQERQPKIQTAPGPASAAGTGMMNQEIDDWYAYTQTGGVSKAEIARTAAGIQERLSEERIRAYLDSNAENGGFVIKLLESWSKRVEGDSSGEPREKREVMRESFRALREMKSSAGSAGSQDDGFSSSVMLEDSESLEETGFDGDDPYPDMDDQIAEVAAFLLNENDDSESVVQSHEMSVRPDTGPEVRGALDADDTAAPDTSGSDSRFGRVFGVIREMRSVMATVAAVLSGESDWPEDLMDDDDRAALFRRIEVDFVNLTGDLDEEELLDVLRGFAGVRDEARWILENSAVLSEGFSAFVGQAMMDDSTSAAGWQDDDEAGVEPGSTDPYLASGTQCPVGTVFSPSDGDVQDAAEAGGVESTAVSWTDVGIPILSEIERAGSSVMEWVRTCREAGASEGSVARVIFRRDGDGFIPLGVAHVSMSWKAFDATLRANIFFRYVPQGDWALRTGADGIWMTSSDGRMVGIGQDLLAHDEIVDNKAVVFFYGVSVSGGKPERIGKNLMVCFDVMSVEDVKNFMTSKM